MAKIPDLTEAEWKVMKVLWKQAPMPAYDIVENLAKKEDWHPSTIKTILTRLFRKKAIAAKKYKNLYIYRPLITEEECVHVESSTFMQRFFGGSVKPLLIHFARKEKLTPADFDELKQILEQNKEGQK